MTHLRRLRLVGARMPRRVVVALTIAAAIVAGAPAASAQSQAERLITDWAQAFRTEGRTVEWGGLSRSMGDERIALTDVTMTLPAAGADPIRITAPSVTVVGLAARDGGGITIGTLTAPRLTLSMVRDGETTGIDVADIEMHDARLPTITLPAIDPDHRFTSALAATRAFDAIAIGRAAIRRVSLQSRPTGEEQSTRITAEDLALAGLDAGRLERFAAGRIAIEAVAASGTARLSVADLTVVGYDPTAWRRAFAERRPDEETAGAAKTEWFALLGSLASGRIALESDGATASIERLAIGSREIGRFDPSVGRTLDRLLAGTDEISQLELARVLLEGFLGTRSGGWTIEGFRLASPSLDRATIGRVVVGAFTADRLAELAVESLDIAVANANLRFARLSARDIGLPDGDDLRRALEASAVGAEVDPSSLVPTLGSLAIDAAEIGEPGVPSIGLGSLRLELGRHLRAVPTTIALTLDHFIVPVGLADAEGRRVLGELGYEKLDFSAAARLAWSEANREVAVEDGRLEIADWGRIDVAGRLAGIPSSLFLHPETAPEVVAALRLIEAKATYTDASFAERIVKMVAKQEKTTPARLRRMLVKEVPGLFEDVRDPARRKRLTEVARRFIGAPKAFTVTARPAEPVALGEILAAGDDLGAMADRLGLTATAE